MNFLNDEKTLFDCRKCDDAMDMCEICDSKNTCTSCYPHFI